MAWTKSATAQMSRIQIAALSFAILLLVLSACFSAARHFWAEHTGILVVAFAVAGEVICDLKEEKSFIDRLRRFFGILLVLGLLWEIREAIKQDKQLAVLHDRAATNEVAVASLQKATIELAHQYDLSTNALAEANARLKVIRPAKERLIDLLNSIDGRVLESLKSGIPVDLNGNLDSIKIAKLDEFATDPETAKYITVKRTGGTMLTIGGQVLAAVIVKIEPALVK